MERERMRVRPFARRSGLVVLAATALAAGGCRHPTGPSLSVEIESARLVPTAQAAGAESLCCCRVRGTVLNTSGIPVHVSARFHATGEDGRAVGTALDFLPDVSPWERRLFDAVGIQEACARVSRIESIPRIIAVYTLGSGS
jgi:hypothetical protein